MLVAKLLRAAMLVTIATLAPSAAADDASTVSEGGDWRAELNRKVASDNHWRWTLRRVERQGDRLVVVLRFRNNASTARPIFIEDEYLTTVALVDDADNERFALQAVDGISGEVTAVQRKTSKSAVFTFTYPEGADSVRFTSKWISMRMGGEARVMQVDFPIDIPPAKAQPG